MLDEECAVSIEELEEGLRALGVSRGLRRAVLADARAVAGSFVADGYPADRVRHVAEVCDCCGALNVTTFCLGIRRGDVH